MPDVREERETNSAKRATVELWLNSSCVRDVSSNWSQYSDSPNSMFATRKVDAAEVVRFIDTHTIGRVRELAVEVWPGRVILRGWTDSFYVKQLAQHHLRQRLPAELALDNLIEVGPASLTDTPRPPKTLRHFRKPLTVGSSAGTRSAQERSQIQPV